jgi:DNA-binding response OmpR family regulator
MTAPDAPPPQASILVVEDDRTTADLVALYLRRDGHRVTVEQSGDRALERLHAESFDLLILDVMLPGANGLEIARATRARGAVPIIFVTARTLEEQRIEGFALGADDYVTKPFSPRELVLRVQAIVRRAAEGGAAAGDSSGQDADAATDPHRVSVDGDLVLDRRAHVVTRNGDPLALTAREFALLDWFLGHPGVVHRRDELMRAVWGWEYGDESTVTVHVRRLREKVEVEPSAPSRLVTVFGVGYRWDAQPSDAA